MPHITIAPMMDYTDRYGRYWIRLFSKHVGLYTEMITTAALIHGNETRLLAYDPCEHPVALQLGGADPTALAHCARRAAAYDFDEVNLNVGCPSDRVRDGHFGACLMADPKHVAACVEAMRMAVDIPITVKTRIGIDHQDSYEALCHFIQTVAEGGCERFIIHARKAWLHGLSPKENRTIPPLRYEIVAQLKKDFPALSFVLNGGITTREAIHKHLKTFDGVMIGRAAFDNPYLLTPIDAEFYGDTIRPIPSREDVLATYLSFSEKCYRDHLAPLRLILHPIMGLWHGESGARAYRRLIGECMRKGDDGLIQLRHALEKHDENA